MLLAQAADAASSITQFAPLLLVGAFVWFVMIRPQRKRAAERKEMMEELGVGSNVVTVGGLHGQVEALDDETVDLLVTDDVVLRFTRQAIGQVIPSVDASAVLDDPLEEDDDEDVDDVWGDAVVTDDDTPDTTA